MKTGKYIKFPKNRIFNNKSSFTTEKLTGSPDSMNIFQSNQYFKISRKNPVNTPIPIENPTNNSNASQDNEPKTV
jgi:hypothetical protein